MLDTYVFNLITYANNNNHNNNMIISVVCIIFIKMTSAVLSKTLASREYIIISR